MTLAEQRSDSLASWALAVVLLRLRAVVAGEAVPREDEPVSLMALWAIACAR